MGIVPALLGGKDLNKPFIIVATIGSVSPRDVAVKRCWVKLCKNIDLWYVAVQTIADRDVDQSVIAA